MMHAEKLVHCAGLQDLLVLDCLHTEQSSIWRPAMAASDKKSLLNRVACHEAATPLTKMCKMRFEPKWLRTEVVAAAAQPWSWAKPFRKVYELQGCLC